MRRNTWWVMPKHSKKSVLSSLNSLDFFEDLGSPLDQSPFKKALKRYFEGKTFVKSQDQLKKEMKHLRKALKEMDEAKMAHDVMEQTRKKLQHAYQEILEKSKA